MVTPFSRLPPAFSRIPSQYSPEARAGTKNAEPSAMMRPFTVIPAEVSPSDTAIFITAPRLSVRVTPDGTITGPSTKCSPDQYSSSCSTPLRVFTTFTTALPDPSLPWASRTLKVTR